MSDKNRFSDSSAKSYSQALYELASEEKKLNDVEEHAISIIMLIPVILTLVLMILVFIVSQRENLIELNNALSNISKVDIIK